LVLVSEGVVGVQIFTVPQLAWYGARDFEIILPENWQVEIAYPAGYNRPELTPEQIQKALKKPAGCPPLKELAKGKKEVAIVFDDVTRVTRVAKIVPHVLRELADAGIPDDNIRFICGLGLHGVMDRLDFVKKLGEDTVCRFRVFNHNPFGNCVFAGTTQTFNTKVNVNEEYMKCDLKIVIGSCVPHPLAGFGGGGKMILPGITSWETTNWHHAAGGLTPDPVDNEKKPVVGLGLVDRNFFKKDIDEAADIAGIDFLINTLTNLQGESVSIHAGDWKLAFAEAVVEARTHYRTPKITGKEVVISNAFAKASESLICLESALPVVSHKGGDLVIIANSPEGQVTHYLLGAFGKSTFGCGNTPREIPDYVNRVIAYSEYPHRGGYWFRDNEKIEFVSKWDKVLNYLESKHGPGTHAVIFPDSTNQYIGWFD
jgi:lactate racemase